MIIMIDPGHGGDPKYGGDPGAIGPSGVHEKDVNLAVSEKLHSLMVNAGLEAYMTRASDVDVALAKRAEMANTINANYFISIHSNASVSPTAHGTETYYYYGSAPGKKLAEAVQAELIKATGLTDRGIKESGFYVLRLRQCRLS